MSRTYEYRSGLASQISAFIAEKRACGCKYEKEAKTFQTLDRFLVEQGINTPVLPELVVEKWIEKRPNEKRKNQKWRLNFTKRFAKYLQLNGYAAYYPELTISSRDDADFSPCIFTSDELARIMKYFETMVPSRQCPTAHLVFPLLFKTLICCGLRAGEATRLRVKDVDLINGVLQIWETKHDKPRYVPLSKSLWADYEQYFEEIHAESSGNNYFFPNPRKSCYHTTTVYNRFRDALWHCGIAHKGRGYGPRVHDLRHTFAVRSMQKLKKSKSDIVTTLPYLSAYLGHCNMSATQIYLHLTAECYPEFIQKQCDYLGDTIPIKEPRLLLNFQQILAIPVKRAERKAINPLTKEAIALILRQPDTSTLSGRRDATILCFLYDTAARVQEICDLRIEDVRLDYPASVKILGKGRKTRVVPILPATAQNLKKYLTEMHMLAPEKSHLPLFMNRNGQKLTRAGVTYILNKYAKAASVIDPSIPEKIPPHLMRHTKAMHIYDADNDLVHVRDFLGHSDIKTTDIYARSSLTMKQKALERVSDSPVPSMPSWQKSRSTMEWLKSFGSQKA